VEDIPLVTNALLEHFNQKGIIATETGMETVFDAKVGVETVSVRLHGKLDAVLENENTVSVFDYKTRRSMSINAIKGETKDSDGGYFRQLVFYKLLISSQEKYKGRRVEPSLVFIKPDDKGRCPLISLPIENVDIESLKKSVNDLVEWVHTGPMPSPSCEDKDCEWCTLAHLN
jgi:DNA helicase-2/ATP-dependent DNA helicase PcrA